MRMTLAHLLLPVLFLCGCAGLGAPPPRMSAFDLGTGVHQAGGTAAATLDVQAPSWLSSAAMQYRRDDHVPAARESYAFSRWAGALPELLSHRIEASLAGASVRLPCRMRIDVDEAIQIYDSPARSRVEWRIRATLLPMHVATPVAQRMLFTVREAATADAAGGISAHREAVSELVAQIRKWLDAVAQDPDVARRCRRSA